MNTKIKKLICVSMCAVIGMSMASCSKTTADTDVINSLFTDLSKISYSMDYTGLKDNKTNKDSRWRQGMVSGNGMQGFITSGDPYSDTYIYQNMHFIIPNDNPRDCPVTFDELETVKQAIVKGEDIVDDASYDDVYTYHPGAQMRITMDAAKANDYVRYTDYETGQVGVHYSDKNGVWDRKAFTSMADGAVITQIASSSTGSKVNMTLSVDDISTIAKFGDGSETGIRYKKIVSDSADYITMVAHYPSFENSELKDGGYATLTYVVTVGGSKEKVVLDTINEEEQYVGDGNQAVKISDADAVYLVTVSDRTHEMGSIDDFTSQQSYGLVDEIYETAKAVADKYSSNGTFDYDAALQNHLDIYQPQFDAVTIELGDENTNQSNEALLKEQRGEDELNSELMERAYYSGRYAYLCCAGYSTSRLYGMWTGEWNASWGSKYTMDANVNLQTSSMNTGNISSAPVGYAYFILRQLPDWEENAYATHGFTDAIQAPVNTDGDKAVITETCYPYPFRYWNAGTSWMIQPLYETLKTYGNINIPLSDEFSLEAVSSVLDLDDEKIAQINEQGYLKLEEDILYPMLIKSVNYWEQMFSPDYYTSADGTIHYEEGKTELADDEAYCILPSYSPENNPSNYPSPSTANCAIDISACKNNIEMLLDVVKDVAPDTDTSKWEYMYEKVPPYLYDETGALKEWATTSFEENNEHRHLSHLYGVWPLFEAQDNEEFVNACEQAIANRESENEASHALVHRSLIAARLKDRDSLTEALTSLMNHKIHYDSLMTNHDYDRGSGYCTDFAIGYLGIVNESLVFSNTGDIEILPALPNTGFDKGKITGIKTRTRATVDSLEWDVSKKTATVEITSDIDQTIELSSPMSDQTETLTFKAGESKTVEFALN
ncbi:MAG TPA: glycoside hydrolase N-terminal domain-containing protein [Candidatus Eubacterium faecigallinarum]|nr:glycoside hydrolase N-terminal domain-containing protein [Candidatus Eubacterium faecigallinarum]